MVEREHWAGRKGDGKGARRERAGWKQVHHGMERATEAGGLMVEPDTG